MKKLPLDFYKRDSLIVAKQLLGKTLVRNLKGVELSGTIIETEAYCGSFDKACHSYAFKRTKRNEVMYREGGISYVYLIYGMYHCFNIVTEDEANPSAVLIRAISPISGKNEMSMLRYSSPYDTISSKQKLNLTNGPGKLCKALNITINDNGEPLSQDSIYILDSPLKDFQILATPRINIGYAEEFVDKPWRFLLT